MPSNIATMFGEEVPELTKNKQGIYTAENARWKSIYENGEWEFLPRPTTAYDEELLEAVKEEYLQREDTPNTMAEVMKGIKNDPEYYQGYNDFLGVINREGTMADIFVFRSKTIGFVEINLEGRPGSKHGDVGIVRVSIRPDLPERYICEIVGIERDGEYHQTAELFKNVIEQKIFLDDKEQLSEFVGELAESYVFYTTPDSGWDGSIYVYPAYYPEYDMVSSYFKNPNGYIERWTRAEKFGSTKGRPWIDIFKEIIDSIKLNPREDFAFITVISLILKP
ncbi:MAG TPA: hypothetical protein G4N92_04415 [Anaerolineae bacterium]|nr:hypothetical protein [Anaerolineae bacterium]